jgi:hypothetical protein
MASYSAWRPVLSRSSRPAAIKDLDVLVDALVIAAERFGERESVARTVADAVPVAILSSAALAGYVIEGKKNARLPKT